jgi:Na+-driven multidrug efflux pump
MGIDSTVIAVLVTILILIIYLLYKSWLYLVYKSWHLRTLIFIGCIILIIVDTISICSIYNYGINEIGYFDPQEITTPVILLIIFNTPLAYNFALRKSHFSKSPIHYLFLLGLIIITIYYYQWGSLLIIGSLFVSLYLTIMFSQWRDKRRRQHAPIQKETQI